MLTPIFTISQSADALTVDIRCPYADIASTQVCINDDEFRFFSKPYFLRLHLPGRIVETGNEVVNYDFDKKEFRVQIAKETPGEHFEGLEFISTLLTKKSSERATAPLIEVVGGENHLDSDDDSDGDEEDEDESGDQWLWDQTAQDQPAEEEVEDSLNLLHPKYGFNGKAGGLFSSKLSEERREITDLLDPDSTSLANRWRLKREYESEKFDADHYLADWIDEDRDIQRLVGAERDAGCEAWTNGWTNLRAGTFTDDEKFALKNFPRREILVSSSKQRRVALLSVLDVLLAAAYDCRTTEGESTVESGWTINKLSATCACFVEFETVFDVVVSFARRSLIFPLYRNWNLALQCVDDVVEMLKTGHKVAVVKRLLDVYKIFVVGDPRYILNDLYVVDMILWAQSTDLSESKVAKLWNALELVKDRIEKKDLGLELKELEAAARIVTQEEEEEEEEEEKEEETSNDSEEATSSSSASESCNESDSEGGEDLEETNIKLEMLRLGSS